MPDKSNSADTYKIDLDFTPTPNVKDKIAPLHQAIKALHLVRFDYLDTKGMETDRTIEPMGLFLKGYVWYMYGYCLTRSDFRVFRLSRINQLRRLPKTFIRRNYTLQDVEQQFMSQANFAKISAVLHFNPVVKTRVSDEFGFDNITENPDGSLSVNAFYSSTELAIQNILSYSNNVTITEPPELIAELQRHVANMLLHYKA
jgi:predicted DNA-binding transcriptional regulator YafY